MEFKSPKNKPYIGEIVGSQLLKEDAAKIYFTNIEGRDPTAYDWKLCGLPQEKLIEGIEKHLTNSENYGTPHIFVSFPHVTVGYRWGDPRAGEQETNLYRVGLGRTQELEDLNLEAPTIPVQMGCPAELFIVGQENIIRAQSSTMNEYLNRFVPNGKYVGSEIINPNLAREFLESKKLR